MRTDWRLSAVEARLAAGRIEGRGYRATPLNIAQGIALVEVRSPARPYPVVRVLRSPADVESFLEEGE